MCMLGYGAKCLCSSMERKLFELDRGAKTVCARQEYRVFLCSTVERKLSVLDK
ncbi:unnamed protein product, partial [Trichogramma brassicae]